MNKDITSYAKVYKNFLDREICLQTIEQTKAVNFQQHTFYNHSTGENIPKSGNKELESFTDLNFDVSNSKLIIDKLWHAIKKYTLDVDIPSFNTWEGYSAIRYNRYFEGKKMALHNDHIKSLFTGRDRGIPILSCLGLLNDDYTGGEFIMFGDEVIDLRQGDLLIFPSIFLYPHMVSPVKNGIRYSYISWVW